MTKRYLSLPAFGLLAAMALPAAAQDADTVVATVNGTDITVGHMIVAHGTLPEQYQSLPANVLFEGILSQLISQTVLSQSLEGELPKRAMLSLDNERRLLKKDVRILKSQTEPVLRLRVQQHAFFFFFY
jgi:peptidyl-prolyl cis-trans isomerase C